MGGREGHWTDESVIMHTALTASGEVRSAALPVRVFILSDHELVRQGLGEVLEHEGFEVAGESGSAAEATRLIPIVKPDVAILDDRLPDGTGIEVCRYLRTTSPEVKCLLLTGWGEQQAVRATVLAGASGYVFKQIRDNNELIHNIRSASEGRPLLPADLRARVTESLCATAGAPWLSSLTERERSVLAFMARGLTNRQIGQELLLPQAAVAGCVSSVLQKLGFRRRGPLAPIAVPLGEGRQTVPQLY